MVSANQVVESAMDWVGTPFKHQGRTSHGIDCIGLLLAVAWELNLYDKDHSVYSRYPQKGLLQKNLDQLLIKAPKKEYDIGYVLMIKIDVDPQHVAIVAPYSDISFGIIHSYYRRGVVYHRLSNSWNRRVVQSYKIPGVDY